MADAQDWRIIDKEGRPHHIGHSSGKYHQGLFLRGWDSGRSEWVERFLVAPITPNREQLYGVALLARHGERYLVQAKAEPGNATPGFVQLTATIHASYENMAAGLSGKVPFQELYNDPNAKRFVVSQDGAQMYLKKNHTCFLELASPIEDLPANFTWATLGEIRELAELGVVSEHLMQCLGVSVVGNLA